MGNEKKNTQKVPFTVRQPLIKLSGVPSNIQYTSKRNDKPLQDKLALINRDQDFLAEKVRELIQTLQVDSRQNDQNIYIKIEEGLKNILDSFGLNKSNHNKIKNFLKNKILQSGITLSDVQKQKIIECINNVVEKNREVDKEITDTLKNYQFSNFKIDKKQTLGIYQSIIGNKLLIGSILKRISNKSIMNTMTTDKKRFKSMIEKFKKSNKILFGDPKKDPVENISFSKLLLSGGKAYLFLKKYNKAVVRRFASRVAEQNKNTLLQQRRNVATKALENELKRNVKEWFKTKFSFTKLFSPKFWKKTIKSTKNSNFNFVKFNGLKGIALGTLNVSASVIAGVGDLLFKGAFAAAKLGLFLIKGIYNIGTKIIGGTITILKNILGLGIKISKMMLGTAASILKKLKIFLLTPFGAYAVGFVIGFLKTKIMQYLKSIFNVSKEKLKELGKWIEEQNSLYNGLPLKIMVDEDGNLKSEDIYNGGDKSELFKKLKNVKDNLKNYVDIFKDNDENNVEQIRKLLNDDTGYIDTVLKMEHGLVELVNWTEKFFDTHSVGSVYNKIVFAFNQMMANELFVELNTLTTLTGTGIPSNKIASGISSQAVKSAFLTGGVILGSFFGPLGTIAGGAIGGMLGALFSYPISKAFISRLSPKEKFNVRDVIQNLNQKYDMGIMAVKRNRKTQIDRLEDEIEALKKQLKNKNIHRKIREELQKKLNTAQDKLNNLEYNFKETEEKIRDRMQILTDSDIVGTNVSTLITFATDKKINKKNINPHNFNIEDLYVDETIKTIFKDKAKMIRFYIEKLAQKYAMGGYGIVGEKSSIDKYLQEVQAFVDRLNNHKPIQNNAITIGDLTSLGQFVETRMTSKLEKHKIRIGDKVFTIGQYNQIKNRYKSDKVTEGLYESVMDFNLKANEQLNRYINSGSVNEEDRDIISKYRLFFIKDLIQLTGNEKPEEINKIIRKRLRFAKCIEEQEKSRALKKQEEQKKKNEQQSNFRSGMANGIQMVSSLLTGEQLTESQHKERYMNDYMLRQGNDISEERKDLYNTALDTFKKKKEKNDILNNLYADILKVSGLAVDPRAMMPQMPGESDVVYNARQNMNNPQENIIGFENSK